MDVKVPLGVMFFFATHNHPIWLNFSIFSDGGFAVAPLLADTNILPDRYAPVHGRILSALETYPGILGEY